MVKNFLSLTYVIGLNYFLFVGLLKVLNFTPHLSTLHFDLFDFVFKNVLLLLQVRNLVTSSDRLLLQASSFEILLVKYTLASINFVLKVAIQFCLL